MSSLWLGVAITFMSAGQMEAERDVSDCARLFRAHESEQTSVHVVHRSPKRVTLAHSGKYRRPPAAVRLEGVQLLEADRERAIFDVNTELDGCPEGRYVLDAGDEIGGVGRIVLIMHGFVIAARDTKLYYIKSRDAERPTWSLVWQSSFPMNGYIGPKRGGRATPAKRPAAKARARAAARKR